MIAGIFAAFIAQGAGAQAPLAPVAGSATEARAAEGRRSGELECLVEPYMTVNVGSSVDGVLEQVTVNRGDRVYKGQVVAKLQSGVEAAAVKLTESRVEFGRRRVARIETLLEKQLISEQEADELKTEVRLREEELVKDQETLRLRTIVSPIDGVVVERRLAPGELIRSEKSVVLKLAQINPLNVEVIAPARLFGTVRVGMPGKVSLAPFFPGTYQAKVVVVDKVIDAASGTMGVRLQLPNPDNKIPAGIKCSVVL
ncbi:MAG: efflux RND transporter periplasmic adaptor subunit [Betaproteobacteria bacterium]|nr:efflux RND transporter periplasmic adaptor subunit [Betaproteobacteria bacterium]